MGDDVDKEAREIMLLLEEGRETAKRSNVLFQDWSRVIMDLCECVEKMQTKIGGYEIDLGSLLTENDYLCKDVNKARNEALEEAASKLDERVKILDETAEKAFTSNSILNLNNQASRFEEAAEIVRALKSGD